MTILDRMRRAAARRGTESGLCFEDRRFTLADVEGGSNAAARVLRAHGVSKGDRVVLAAETSLEGMLAHLGALKLGAISIPTNPGYKDAELGWILEDAEPRVIVCDSPRAARCVSLASASVRAVLEIERGERDETSSADGPRCLPFYQAVRKASVHPVDELVWDSDAAMILYTSGTTGRAKGARLDHGNLDANIAGLVDAFGWTADDRLLLTLPQFHVHGLCVGLHGALVTGCETRLMARFDASEIPRLLERDQSTLFLGVPTMYHRLASEAPGGRVELPSMRLFVSGSAPLPVPVAEAFERTYGHRLLERYGMTETLITISQRADGPRQFGAVGTPIAGTEARVVDDAGAAVGPDEPGELQVRGSSVGPGYWNDDAATEASWTADGWFRTGDRATRDAAGAYRIVGRSKEMILTGGLNVYPREVEELLLLHDDVAEVAVFGRPDDDLGEAVCAAVVARAGTTIDATALVEFCRERLAGYKKPTRVTVVESLPRNAMGKVDKGQLRG